MDFTKWYRYLLLDYSYFSLSNISDFSEPKSGQIKVHLQCWRIIELKDKAVNWYNCITYKVLYATSQLFINYPYWSYSPLKLLYYRMIDSCSLLLGNWKYGWSSAQVVLFFFQTLRHCSRMRDQITQTSEVNKFLHYTHDLIIIHILIHSAVYGSTSTRGFPNWCV